MFDSFARHKRFRHIKLLGERAAIGARGSFPKNPRFIFGTPLADAVLAIMELLVEVSYSRTKLELLRRANVQIEQLRWMIRLAKDRAVLTPRQYEYSAEQLTECGRMLGGWMKQ